MSDQRKVFLAMPHIATVTYVESLNGVDIGADAHDAEGNEFMIIPGLRQSVIVPEFSRYPFMHAGDEYAYSGEIPTDFNGTALMCVRGPSNHRHWVLKCEWDVCVEQISNDPPHLALPIQPSDEWVDRESPISRIDRIPFAVKIDADDLVRFVSSLFSRRIQ